MDLEVQVAQEHQGVQEHRVAQEHQGVQEPRVAQEHQVAQEHRVVQEELEGQPAATLITLPDLSQEAQVDLEDPEVLEDPEALEDQAEDHVQGTRL